MLGHVQNWLSTFQTGSEEGGRRLPQIRRRQQDTTRIGRIQGPYKLGLLKVPSCKSLLSSSLVLARRNFDRQLKDSVREALLLRKQNKAHPGSAFLSQGKTLKFLGLKFGKPIARHTAPLREIRQCQRHKQFQDLKRFPKIFYSCSLYIVSRLQLKMTQCNVCPDFNSLKSNPQCGAGHVTNHVSWVNPLQMGYHAWLLPPLNACGTFRCHANSTTPRYAKIKIATQDFFLARDAISAWKLFAMPVLTLRVLSFSLAPSRTGRISI
jgi:hypothetical protein